MMTSQDQDFLTDNHQLACRFAAAGFPVFPCREEKHVVRGKVKKEKSPYTENGFKDAARDRDTLDRWWRCWPGAVPGIPTGAASGLAVIDGDIDRDTGEALGEAEIDALRLANPLAVRVRTHSGGVHLLFRHVEGATCTTKQAAANVDTRGEGGYVIAPGSVMGDGARYAYESRTLAAALRAGDLPPYPLDAVKAAIAARRAEKACGGGPTNESAGFRFDTGGGDKTEATEAETLEALRALLAIAPNDLCREDWVKLAVSLRVEFGDALRPDFVAFSVRYSGSPCSKADALHVWNSADCPNEVSSIRPALALLRDAIGEQQWRATWRYIFARRDEGDRTTSHGAQPPEGPQPLIREVPDAAPYPVSALGPLRQPVEAIAEATEAPPALCAASVLAAAALGAQGLRDVETLGGPRPTSLFFLTVAGSGERKSSADKLAKQGVRSFEEELARDYDDDQEAYQRELSIWEKRRTAILRNADENPDATRADLEALGPMPEPPLRPSIVTGSATMEGIIKHLPELRASLGVMTDEGGLLLGGHSMKAENKLATLSTLAAMWDGTPLDRWRAGDGIARHSGRRFSSHLLIQPKAVEGFLTDPLANGQGLLARFLTCQPASHIGKRLRLTESPQAAAEVDRFSRQIEALLTRPLSLADGRRNELAPPVLTLAPDARAVLTDFARAVEMAQAVGGAFEECRAFASKAAEHAARIAAVLTVFADPEAMTVDGETMVDAVTLATFYANEAVRLHAAAVVPAHVADAEQMRRWLQNAWPEEHISAAVAARLGPFKLTERCRKALALLETHDWLVKADGSVVGGRPRKEAWKVVRP